LRKYNYFLETSKIILPFFFFFDIFHIFVMGELKIKQ